MENGLAHKVTETHISWRHRLLTRTLLFLIVPCVLPLLLVCGGILYYVGVDAQRQTEEALLASISSVSRKVAYYFTELEGNMKFVASRFDHDNLASPGNKNLVVAFATTAHRDIETVWVRNRHGETSILYSRHEMLDQKKPPPVDPAALVQNAAGVTWHATIYNEFGDPIITGSVPIQHPWDENSFGALIFTVQPQYLQTITKNMNIGQAGLAFLADHNGRLISHNRDSATAVAGRDISSQPAMRWLGEAMAGDESPHVAYDPDHLVAYSKIAPLQWGIVIQRPSAEVYQRRNQLAWLVIGAFLLLILLLVPLVISFSMRMTKPISALLHAIQKFASNDHFNRDELSDHGEIGLLAEAFGHMAEQRLKSEKRYREIVDGTDNFITQVDQEGLYLFVNHVGEKVFGVALDQLIGRSAFEFVHPEDRERTEEWFTQCVEKGRKQATIQNRLISPDGNKISHFLWNCHLFYNDKGQFQGMNGIAHDITERRLAEEEKRAMEERLLQSQKMESIGTLAGGIAHDFNNILTPILGYAELIQDMVPPSGPVADGIKAIRKAGLRAKDLVQQILTFSRRVPHEKTPLLPHLIIKETIKFLRSSLPATVEVRENISSECGMILGDPTQLQQIIMNLGTNAYHAMRERGGVLGITLKKIDISEQDMKVVGVDMAAGPYVQIEVSDTGCGMDHATMAKIFEPYFTTKKKGEGTGLGLAIVHGIVKSYEGHITVYSEPGHGTTFHVYLPRVDAEQVSAEGPHAEQEALPRGTERVLVVDDEQQITSMLHDMLVALGYRPTVCNESEEALRVIQKNPGDFDLLITDMTMPHLTGLDLTTNVLKLRPDMPVILCTGFSELITKEKAVTFGVREFLMKPVALKDMAHAIRRAIEKK